MSLVPGGRLGPYPKTQWTQRSAEGAEFLRKFILRVLCVLRDLSVEIRPIMGPPRQPALRTDGEPPEQARGKDVDKRADIRKPFGQVLKN